MTKRRSESNWLNLHSDLLLEIACRINCWQDFVAFSGVCGAWRSVAEIFKENFNCSSQVPWLLLGQKLDEEDDDGEIISSNIRVFFNVLKDNIYVLHLPEAIDNKSSWIEERRYFLSSNGYFFLVEKDQRLSLLNPFSLSKTKIDLPLLFTPHSNSKPLSKIDFHSKPNNVVTAFALSSNPTLTSSGKFTAMILYYKEDDFERYTRLAFCKQGDSKWTHEIGSGFCYSFRSHYWDITYHNGRFYVVQYISHGMRGEGEYVILEINIINEDDDNASSSSTRTWSFYKSQIEIERAPFWLVGSGGILMLVFWKLELDHNNNNTSNIKFQVDEIDLENGELKRVQNFGDKAALFLGYRWSSFIDVSNQSQSRYKPNHIYYIANFQNYSKWNRNRRFVGVYNMSDGSTESFLDGRDYGLNCSVQWIQPAP